MNRINFGGFNAKSLIFCSCTFRSFFCQHLWVSAELVLFLSLPCFHLDILNDFKDMTYHCYTNDIHLYKSFRIYKNVLKNQMAANYLSLKKSFLSLLAFFSHGLISSSCEKCGCFDQYSALISILAVLYKFRKKSQDYHYDYICFYLKMH